MSNPALRDPAIAPLWAAVRDRLERRGLDNRGRLAVPDLDAGARLTLKNLLDRPRTPLRIDLGELEAALVGLNIGTDLPSALEALGHEASIEPARRRAERARRRAAREAARTAVTSWPESWSREWVETVIRSGVFAAIDEDKAVSLVEDTRRILDTLAADSVDADTGHTSGDGVGDGVGDGDTLEESGHTGAEADRLASGHEPLFETSHGISQVDLAAGLLGDAHALDPGRPHRVAVVRALALRHGFVGIDAETDVLAAAGIHPDLTSGPVLTWRLPVLGGLSPMIEAATAAGVPVHLSRMALLDHPPGFEPGTEVLIVENPRIVEAAAQLRVATPVISAAGSPSSTVQFLVRQLLEADAVVRYHGDFDAAGIALCARMHADGVIPWRMTAQDYLDALAAADARGVVLPLDENSSPETPWDPALQEAFDADRRIVHEERLLPELLL